MNKTLKTSYLAFITRIIFKTYKITYPDYKFVLIIPAKIKRKEK